MSLKLLCGILKKTLFSPVIHHACVHHTDLSLVFAQAHPNKPHVILGSETWLSSSVNITEIIPDSINYALYYKDRGDGYGRV